MVVAILLVVHMWMLLRDTLDRVLQRLISHYHHLFVCDELQVPVSYYILPLLSPPL